MTDECLPLVGVVAKLQLKPDDIVVLKVDQQISTELESRIRRHFEQYFRVENKIVVLSGGIDIEVLSPQGVLNSREVADT